MGSAVGSSRLHPRIPAWRRWPDLAG